MYRFTNLWLSAVCMAAAILCAGSLTAHANLILNGGFDDDVLSTSIDVSAASNPGAVSNWTVTQYNAMLITDKDSWVITDAKDGDQFWLTSICGGGPCKIQQTFDTESGKTYDVSFYYAFPDATHYAFPSNYTGSVVYDVGGTPTTLSVVADTPWTKEAFQFTASGLHTTLTFSGGASAGTMYPSTAVDNVVVTLHDVPEPGTMALLLSAAAGLLCYAWRKRR